jgi:solute carrier family 6 GABA transporter-like protein 1
VIGEETVAAMIPICEHLAVLDLTGVRGCNDDFAADILEKSPNLKRLSLKNCRKITDKTLSKVAHLPKLQCLDVGGCFNLTTAKVLEIVPNLPELNELHASGLLWKDYTVKELVEIRDTWKGLSLGFSMDLTQSALRESLIHLGDSLESLALPFCESVVDNALLGMLGRNLPRLQFLDLRGNPSLSTLTGWYDGRASADLPAQPLTVLARFSSLSESSVEETRRVHPVSTAENRLTVYLDGGGMGAGIIREVV